MSELPFRPQPDPRFHVDSAQHREALAQLLQGLERGDAFMLLTGDFGVGKTTLAQRLLDAVDRDRFNVACMLASHRAGDELLRSVAIAFGVALPEDAAPMDALQRFAVDQRRAHRAVLLVIDEAQDLDADSLQRLAELAALRVDEAAVFHLCLVGQHAPPALADWPVGTTCHLRPLGRDEVQDYVEQRLSRAGWNGRPSFDAAAIDEIQRRCNGVPRDINRLAHRVLLDLHRSGAARATAASVAAADDALRAELASRPPATGSPGATPPAFDVDDQFLPDWSPAPPEPLPDLETMMAAVLERPATEPVPMVVEHLPVELRPPAPPPVRRRAPWRAGAVAAVIAAVAAGVFWPGRPTDPVAPLRAVILEPADPPAVLTASPPRAGAVEASADGAAERPSGCSAAAASMGLCGVPQRPQAAPAEPARLAASAPASAPEPVACEPSRAAMGLCDKR